MPIYLRNREALLKYKYSSTDKSLTSKYILNPYWNWLVTLFPKSMAPNAITLSGLALVFVNFCTLLYFNPTLACGPKPLHVSKGGDWDPLFKSSFDARSTFHGWASWLGFAAKQAVNAQTECAPRWLYWTFAAGLFMYQSLDAIDGKQARRTGTSGPLGELFDHGCDAINTTLGVILTASALNLGLDWWTVVSLTATTANFYLTTWEEFHTGTLYLSEFSGPVEGILLVVGLFATTGFVGPAFWDQGILTVTGLKSIPFIASLPIKNLPLNECFLVFSSVGLLFNIVSSTRNVYASLPAKNRSPVSLVRPFARLLPYTLHTTAMVLWLHALPQTLLRTTLLLPFLMFWGVAFAHHVQLLILSHLTASPFPAAWKHPLLLLSILGSADANASRWGYKSWLQTTDERIKWTVLGCLATAVLVYAHFGWEVIGIICEFFEMNCLTIKHRQPVLRKTDSGRQIKTLPPTPAEVAKAKQEKGK